MLRTLFGNPKKHPYNQASRLFSTLQTLEPHDPTYLLTIGQIIRLAQEAIGLSNFDADAHVLLANAYLLAAFATIEEPLSQTYVQSISKSAAVIYQWKNSLERFSNFKEQGNKIYREVIQQLAVMSPASRISQLHTNYYDAALGRL